MLQNGVESDIPRCLVFWCYIFSFADGKHFVGTWKSRYHYNVADTRLRQHVDKGNEDGLFISSVASAGNLWALIMDAGTGFTSQVYELSTFFLHKVL